MDVNNTKFNYYDILELSPHCPQHEVTEAYEKMKTTYSGDNPAIYTIFSLGEARDMLGLIEEAYSVLGNKTLRTQYDEKMNLSAPKSKDADHSISKTRGFEIPKKSNFTKPTYTQNPSFERELETCVDWSGEMLKKVRTYKNWKVDALAELTKIGSFYITGIENVEPQNLPAPVFVRGYIIQLCRVYGLNEKLVADSYMKHFKSKLGQ